MTAIFAHPEFSGHEQIILCSDRSTGLRAIIAIHDTRLGPAFGGCRMRRYNDDAEAITDALRLSAAMTHKNAVAGLDLGGGKAVIIGDPRTDKSPALMEAFARHLDSLAGRYTTAEDMGMTEADMRAMKRVTQHVRGTHDGDFGDPSPFTAWGLLHGIRAALRAKFGSDDLTGRRILVQGVGYVGYQLCRLVHDAGAKLSVSDLHEQNTARAAADFGATIVSTDDAHRYECDIWSPCAVGGVINAHNLDEIGAAIIAGAANNQLATEADGQGLHARGILYAPDYVINAGGVISFGALEQYPTETLMRDRISKLDGILTEIFQRASAQDKPTSDIAREMAEQRLASVSGG